MTFNLYGKFFPFVILFFFTLWDIYHLYFGKIFDIFGFVTILIFFVLHSKAQKIDSRDFFLLLFCGLSFLGLIFDPFAQFGFLIGVFAYFFFITIKTNLDSYIYFLIVLFFVLQLIDAVAFFGFGKVLSFYPDAFNPKRNYDGSFFFRPTGIFAEANALSVTMLMLFGMLKEGFKRYTYACIITVISLMLSFSLFGILAAFVISSYLFVSSFNNKNNPILLISIVFSFLFSMSYIITELPYVEIFLDRLENMRNDPSFISRFGLDNKYELDVFIPQGFLTNPLVMQYHAANGYLSLFYASGVLFPFFLYLYLNIASSIRQKLIYLLILVSNPLFSTAFFWAFLAYTRKNK